MNRLVEHLRFRNNANISFNSDDFERALKKTRGKSYNYKKSEKLSANDSVEVDLSGEKLPDGFEDDEGTREDLEARIEAVIYEEIFLK